MLGQTGKNGNTVPREFQPQKLSFFIIIGSFILENKNKMVFLSSYSPVLHWPSKHLTSCQSEDGGNERIKDTAKQEQLLLAPIAEKDKGVSHNVYLF